MKKIIYLVISFLTLTLFFTSCSSSNDSNLLSLNEFIESEDNIPDITILSPVTLSNNDMFPINGQHQYLRLKMVKGIYYEDWSPGAHVGPQWEGYYTIELTDEYGNSIAETDLSRIYKESLLFNAPFEIQFDDYNNDGNMDFTIGQYTTSNGRDYKLFTLRADGKVEELIIKDYSSLFISTTTGYYSTKLTIIENGSFKIEYYDNSQEKYFEDVFKWDGNKFIKADRNN
ncbi:hypothetical protein [Alkaliphilus peptidifermentans]|uniref:Lipoprotein n=1 Tax=Alkaliphilus peptidifermentans DSM 18978 TaxID=1120976 RepID=A0A1G5GZ20_9FIRM|nr:hypothetical protein [Alkaliphilus peptidifermentans]SCY56380.1 hypothetical protein SAMN03080606_01827 [Alkaliphilus peptidifermentans DSM 18978]